MNIGSPPGRTGTVIGYLLCIALVPVYVNMFPVWRYLSATWGREMFTYLPPLALLVGLLLLVAAAAALLVVLDGPTFPLWIAGSALCLVGLGVALGWMRYGREAVPFRYLLLVPVYVVWKIPMYLSFLFGRREQHWRRTER